MVLIGAAAIMLNGCHKPSHAEAKQHAEQRWNEVRGRVKFQLARQQYDGGLFEDVVHSVSESVALDPARPEAYVLLAQANLELSKSASAEQAIEAACRAGLDSADLHYIRGVILEQRNDLTAAVGEYGRARAMNAEDVDYLVAQAECLVALDRPAEALALLDENRNRFDEDATVAVLAGRIAVLLGDLEDAAARLGQAAAALSDSRVVAEELGLLFVRAGRCPEAVSLLRPLLDDAGVSEGGAARSGLATCYLDRGDPTSAKEVLMDYGRLRPHDRPAQLLLAKAALETNDFLTAARSLDLVEQLAPGRPDVALIRAATQWKRTEYAAAADTLYRLLEIVPAHVEAYCLLAEVLRQQGQDDAAQDCLERAIRLDPDCRWAQQALAALAAEDAPGTLSARPAPPTATLPTP